MQTSSAERLSVLAQIPTVSPLLETSGMEPFEQFIQTLASLYPLLNEHLRCERVHDLGLLFRWEGSDASLAREPLLLMSHFDVLPAAEEELWTYPPFDGIIANGRVWGRGTLDGKGPLVTICEAIESLLASGFRPVRDVYLSLSGNQEIRGDAAAAIAQTLRHRDIKPYLVLDEGGAVVDTPLPLVSLNTALVGVAEKGMMTVRLSAQGESGPASAPTSLTAVARIARAVSRLTASTFAAHLPDTTITMLSTLAPYTPGVTQAMLKALVMAPALTGQVFALLGGEIAATARTTLAATMIEGGTSATVLPASASAILDIRIAISETTTSALNRITSRIFDPKVTVTMVEGWDPTTPSSLDNAQFDAIRGAVETSYPGTLTVPHVLLDCTDARHFRDCGEAVYRFTPLTMNGVQRAAVHGVDEWVDTNSLSRGQLFHEQLIRTVAGAPAVPQMATSAQPEAVEGPGEAAAHMSEKKSFLPPVRWILPPLNTSQTLGSDSAGQGSQTPVAADTDGLFTVEEIIGHPWDSEDLEDDDLPHPVSLGMRGLATVEEIIGHPWGTTPVPEDEEPPRPSSTGMRGLAVVEEIIGHPQDSTPAPTHDEPQHPSSTGISGLAVVEEIIGHPQEVSTGPTEAQSTQQAEPDTSGVAAFERIIGHPWNTSPGTIDDENHLGAPDAPGLATVEEIIGHPADTDTGSTDDHNSQSAAPDTSGLAAFEKIIGHPWDTDTETTDDHSPQPATPDTSGLAAFEKIIGHPWDTDAGTSDEHRPQSSSPDTADLFIVEEIIGHPEDTSAQIADDDTAPPASSGTSDPLVVEEIIGHPWDAPPATDDGNNLLVVEEIIGHPWDTDSLPEDTSAQNTAPTTPVQPIVEEIIGHPWDDQVIPSTPVTLQPSAITPDFPGHEDIWDEDMPWSNISPQDGPLHPAPPDSPEVASMWQYNGAPQGNPSDSTHRQAPVPPSTGVHDSPWNDRVNHGDDSPVDLVGEEWADMFGPPAGIQPVSDVDLDGNPYAPSLPEPGHTTVAGFIVEPLVDLTEEPLVDLTDSCDNPWAEEPRSPQADRPSRHKDGIPETTELEDEWDQDGPGGVPVPGVPASGVPASGVPASGPPATGAPRPPDIPATPAAEGLISVPWNLAAPGDTPSQEPPAPPDRPWISSTPWEARSPWARPDQLPDTSSAPEDPRTPPGRP
ncbi:MAG: M20/M25/M40 family metallo-hydrolase [Propionibacteriaceae bacterium]|nr:M20/M25/M40 family metallo-hydrolase [Propionibacteriaceae bacterium]